jgi:uncharacterized protein YjbI with pentapeptide repeats
MTQCLFQSDVDSKRCGEKADRLGDLCIFHDPSPEKEPTGIRKRLEARIDETAKDSILRLDGSIFPRDVSFRDLVFRSSVSFRRAEFHDKTTDFSGAQFHGLTTSFSSAQFNSERINFERVKFHGETTDFAGAEFRGKTTNFNFCRFRAQTTDFHSVNFGSNTTNFIRAAFYSETCDFSRAKFHTRTTNFLDVQFYGQPTTFRRAEFRGNVLFSTIRPEGMFHKATVSFERISVSENAEIIFDGVNLSKTKFIGVDLARIKFLDVKWNHAAGWWRGRWRSRLYDEECWREKRLTDASRADSENLGQLARLYRALKAYYRQTGEYKLFGHFHYGLMEVQWHQLELEDQPPIGASRGRRLWLWLKRKSRKWLSWEALYRFSSGYGESYARSASVLGLLIVGFAAVYWWLGVPTPLETHRMVNVFLGTPTHEGLQYISLGAKAALDPTPWWGHEWLAALAYSLQTASIGRLHYFNDSTPPSRAAEIAYTFESILGPVQIAFFAVALRNRFRR